MNGKAGTVTQVLWVGKGQNKNLGQIRTAKTCLVIATPPKGRVKSRTMVERYTSQGTGASGPDTHVDTVPRTGEPSPSSSQSCHHNDTGQSKILFAWATYQTNKQTKNVK